MNQNAIRDDNFVTSLLAESSSNAGVTVRLKGDESTGRLLVDSASGSGTVTSVSVVTANGFAGSVATATTTPAITLSTTLTTPVLAGNGTALIAATTTGSTSTVVLQTSPTLITPVLGVATATSINGLTITSSTGTLTIANGKTLTASNTLTFTGTDGSSVNFGTGGTVLYTASAISLTVGTTTIASGTNTRILYDNAGVLGEYTITGTGTVVAMQTSPSLLTSLLMDSGFVMNWASSNVVLTHSSGILTLGTGDLRVTTAGTNSASVVTVGGTQTLTNKTLTSPAITTATLSGAQQLAEGAGLRLDATLSADGTWSGTTISGTAGATLAFGDLIYLAVADSRWELADASAVSTGGSVLVGFCVLAAASDGDPTVILLDGNIRADTAFPTLTVGAAVFISETAGDVTNTAPTTTDSVTRIVGFGLDGNTLLVRPDAWITHT